MDIRIFGHRDLEPFLETYSKQYDVVYYTPSEWPELKFVQDKAMESLHLPVDDIDHYEFKLHVAPTAPDVKKFLDFAKGRKKLAVACRVGICRSSATAYIIAAREFGSIGGLEVLKPAHHSPNRLIVYIGSQLLKNPDVWNKYVEWTKTWVGHDPSQGGRWPTSKLISQMEFDKV